MQNVPNATVPSQRGALRANAGVKRVPSATPMHNCAALLSSFGNVDSSIPLPVSTSVTVSAPSTAVTVVGESTIKKARTKETKRRDETRERSATGRQTGTEDEGRRQEPRESRRKKDDRQ